MTALAEKLTWFLSGCKETSSSWSWQKEEEAPGKECPVLLLLLLLLLRLHWCDDVSASPMPQAPVTYTMPKCGCYVNNRAASGPMVKRRRERNYLQLEIRGCFVTFHLILFLTRLIFRRQRRKAFSLCNDAVPSRKLFVKCSDEEICSYD